MELITSVNNQRVKEVANLKQKKYRTESGTFFAEGLRAVQGGMFRLIQRKNLKIRKTQIITMPEPQKSGIKLPMGSACIRWTKK